MQATLAALLDPNKLGTGIISPDGEFLVIPLISRSAANGSAGEKCDIITALSTGLIDASQSFKTQSMNSFQFMNPSQKTIIFPLGCVISGQNTVQDRVLTLPALCPPGSNMDFGAALCGNARALVNGELESHGALLPVCVTSGNPLIQPNREQSTPRRYEMEIQRDIQRVHMISLRETESSREREMLEYLTQTTAFFLERGEGMSDECKSYLEHQSHELKSVLRRFENQSSHRLPRSPIEQSPVEFMSRLVPHRAVRSARDLGYYPPPPPLLEREFLEGRDMFMRSEPKNIQSQLWSWVSSQPEGVSSTYQLLQARQSKTIIPTILRQPRKNEVGLLIVGVNHFSLNYLPDEEAWAHYRIHFLTSYFSSHQRQDTNDVDFLSIADSLLDSLREQIRSSEQPVVLEREAYRVQIFTDGFFKAWGLQGQRRARRNDGQDDGAATFEYVAIHGVPKKI
jgi:hypothetical protein